MTIDRSTPIDQLPELLRVEEAALVLGCSKGLVYELAHRCELPSLKLGRLLRIPRAGLAALVGNGNGKDREHDGVARGSNGPRR